MHVYPAPQAVYDAKPYSICSALNVIRDSSSIMPPASDARTTTASPATTMDNPASPARRDSQPSMDHVCPAPTTARNVTEEDRGLVIRGTV